MNAHGNRPGKGGVTVVDTTNGKSKTYPGIGFIGVNQTGTPDGGNPDPRIGLSYSPDGKYLAVGNGYGKATVLRLGDGLSTTLSLAGANLISLSFLPTGDQVVTATTGEVLTWNIAANTALPEHGQGDWGTTSALTVALDLKRKRFIVAGADARVHVWSTETLRPIGISARLGQGIENLAVDPATGDIAAALYETSSPNGPPKPGAGIDVLQSSAPFKVISHLADPGAVIGFGAAYSPAGKQLAVTTASNGGDAGVAVYDVGKSVNPSYRVRVDDLAADAVRWSTDGSRLSLAETFCRQSTLGLAGSSKNKYSRPRMEESTRSNSQKTGHSLLAPVGLSPARGEAPTSSSPPPAACRASEPTCCGRLRSS